jgi:hypothetical protein
LYGVDEGWKLELKEQTQLPVVIAKAGDAGQLFGAF